MKIKIVKPTISNFKVVGGKSAWLEVVKSARLSGVSEEIPAEEIFKQIVNNDYSSALEHIVVKYDIQLSKGNACEFLEHRICSHSGKSTRYTKAGKNNIYEIIVPFHILKKEEKEKSQKYIFEAIRQSIDMYNTCLNNKIPREISRYMLPFASAVAKYRITMNLRSLINFLSLRLCVRTSPEMHCIASQLYFLLEEKLPIIKNMLGCRGYNTGVCPEKNVTGYRSGENKKCPFSNLKSNCFIPTKSEIGEASNINKIEINRVQKLLYTKWANWI